MADIPGPDFAEQTFTGPIYFVRHGQTDWNAVGRFQGQRDIPLNDTGRAQASLNGARLAQVLEAETGAFDFIASPLSRTRETMERLRAAMGLEPGSYAIDPSIIELSFGEWEGRTFEEIQQHYPDEFAKRELDKWHFMPPGEMAESYETLSWRIAKWLATVKRPAICVTHGGVIRALFKLTGMMTDIEAAVADIHQDRALKFENGRIFWID